MNWKSKSLEPMSSDSQERRSNKELKKEIIELKNQLKETEQKLRLSEAINDVLKKSTAILSGDQPEKE